MMSRAARRLLSSSAGLFAFALAAQASAAQLVFLPDGAEATLKAAIDAAPATGTLVLVVPPGSWVYAGTVGIARSHVVIIGSGPGQSRLYRTSEEAAALIQASNAEDVRIAELRVDGNAAADSASQGAGIRFNTVTDLRVDHCSLSDHGASAVRTNGASTGVVHDCTFTKIYKAPIANLGYGVVVYGAGTIDNEPFGSAKATFIEDSSFADCRHAVASNNGARYVFRHNTVRDNVVSHAIDAHGQEYGSTVGTEWVDVNNNLVTDPVYDINAVRIRGGKGVVWSNDFQGYTYGVGLTETTPQATGPVYVWGNKVTGQQINAGAGSTYETTKPSTYVPYPYPHPLAVALVSAAGPDMVVEEGAEVWLDGSASKAGSGSISAYRWVERLGVVSTCARAVAIIGTGTGLLVLETERDDGLVAHDTVVVQAVAPGTLKSSASWADRWFRPIVGQGKVTASITPAASPMDGYLSLSGRHKVGAHEDNAVIVRAANTGRFDARNGDAYAAVNQIPYVAGKTYQLEFELDIATQKYSATIDGVVLAKDYDFRRSETEVGQMNAWHASGGIAVGPIAVAGDLAQPDPACSPPIDGGTDAASSQDAAEDVSALDGAAGHAGSGEGGGAGQGAAAGASGLDAGSEAATGLNAGSSGDDGGCGCRLSGPRAPTAWAALLAGLLFVTRTTRGGRRAAGRAARSTPATTKR